MYRSHYEDRIYSVMLVIAHEHAMNAVLIPGELLKRTDSVIYTRPSQIMSLSVRVISCVVLFTLMLFPHSSAQQADSSNPNSAASAKFAELSDQFMKDSLALSPTNASTAGYHNHLDKKTGKTVELDALLDDMSLQFIETESNFYREWRKRFHEETPVATLSPEDAADWHLIDDQIGLNLLEFDKIQDYRHNPTVAVELIGNALFLPLTQNYAPQDVRLGHVLSRIRQIPRRLDQVKQYLSDVDPIFTSTAIEENDGNIDLVQNTVAQQIPANSKLKAEYDQVTPPAVAALKQFSQWLKTNFSQATCQSQLAVGEGIL